ncbi:hypothetical protein [Halocatena pleomorpha]|uniref:Uncharacterized protein n=1 Tax=Halocatena pleomorpha TaxID=1785090 RepID=A0A3P3R5Y3_9EURY|nr:hypothetical protein [Halocatena pleomorpha]RRJ28784.1 hypothetical protein EIK79_14770 [Halocatena pleomorpha]
MAETMTTFEDAHYRWKDEPVDGEYELQFDRFEMGDERYEQAVLLIVSKENRETIGHVVLPTTDVPHINPHESTKTKIYHGKLKDAEIVELKYDSELSKQRHKEGVEALEYLQGKTDEEGSKD